MTASNRRGSDASSDAGSDRDISSSTPRKVQMDNDIAKRRTLFVRGLPFTSTSEALSAHFSFVAPIKHATIVQDPNTKQSRGFGFVTFTDAEDAQKAIKEFHGKEFEGRKLKVEVAEPRHRQDPAAKQKKEDVKKRAPRLIVRNLPWSVKKPEQLIKVFQSYGKVKEVIIPKKPSGELKGFAFVTMKGYKNAEKAIEKVNGTQVEGRTVAVDWAVEKGEWVEMVAKGQVATAPKPEDMQDEEASEDEEEGGAAVEEEEQEDEEDEEAAEEEEEDQEEDEEDEEDEDEDDEDDEDEDDDDEEDDSYKTTDSSTTLFIRNLPFTTDDDALYEHFSQFGPVRYARIVMDHVTARPKGTGFVCFYDPEIAETCLRGAPRDANPSTKPSLLQSEDTDPLYVLDGRTLSITRAVDRNEASKLETNSAKAREKTSNDKRRLFLLKEGNIPASSPAYQKLSPAERKLRQDSIDQRKKLLAADPNLHLSLTRLSVRNIPRWVTGSDLKAFARKAIPGFMESVKAGERAPLSKEELYRDGEEGKQAEAARRAKGKGVVKQAKIQLEKVGGRSRGYGFIEYYSHRNALMGLRYLNGFEVPGVPPATAPEPEEEEKGKGKKGGAAKARLPQRRLTIEPEKKKRLVVEFAIENAKVVKRRAEMENRSKEFAAKQKEEVAAGGKRKRAQEEEEEGGKGGTRGRGGKGNKKPKTEKKKVVKHANWNKKVDKKPKLDARRGKGGFKK